MNDHSPVTLFTSFVTHISIIAPLWHLFSSLKCCNLFSLYTCGSHFVSLTTILQICPSPCGVPPELQWPELCTVYQMHKQWHNKDFSFLLSALWCFQDNALSVTQVSYLGSGALSKNLPSFMNPEYNFSHVRYFVLIKISFQHFSQPIFLLLDHLWTYNKAQLLVTAGNFLHPHASWLFHETIKCL